MERELRDINWFGMFSLVEERCSLVAVDLNAR